MAIKMQLTQKMAQKMALTPQMRQSIHILQLPLLELRGYLEQQIEENPTLEDERELEPKDTISDERITKVIEQTEEYGTDYETFFNAGFSREELQKKRDSQETLITKGPTLQEYLLKQLRMQPLSETELKIGELIISYIDENGYFQGTLDQIVQILVSKDTQVTLEDIQKILTLIQTFEPIGIGATNLKECLFIQLKAKGKQDSLCYKIIENHLPELARNKIRLIAKSLKVSIEQIKQAVAEISQLEPKPGRSFTQAESRRISHSDPDIIVEKIEDRFEVTVNERKLPRLRISPHYKKLLSQKDVAEKTKTYLKEKINSALGLIKAVMQRNETIRSITECIMKIQNDFFNQGRDECLKPLTLQEVANLVGRNESTISRVVNNKYIQTPFGIFKLSYFFSGSFKTAEGEAISSESIKSKVISLIDEENPQKPLSDEEIVKHFAASGINVARRTIAKYRKELKIPPSNLRRQQNT